MEVLVAFLVASISLSWLLYGLSNSMRYKWEVQKQFELKSLLKEVFYNDVLSSSFLDDLKNDVLVTIKKDSLTFSFQKACFWPFKDEYLKEITIEPLDEVSRTVWQDFSDKEDIEQIHLFFVRAEVFKDQKLLAEMFLSFHN